MGLISWIAMISLLQITGASLFSHVSTLLLIGGGILAIVGLCRIYFKWNTAGAHNIDAEVITWIGGILFLLLSGAVVKILFGM